MMRKDAQGPEATAESPANFPNSDAEVVPPKYWHELTEIYFSQARQEHTDLSGLLIDIDATKAANDELGHEEGTRLINMVDGLTALIPHQVRHDTKRNGGRPVDVVTSHSSEPPELEIPGLVLPEPQTARIGGDEFGILLPRTDEAGALVVRDRFYEAINGQLNTPGYEPLRKIGVGVSIGVASLDPSMKTASDFLRAMDSSMYGVKVDQAPELSKEGLVEFAKAMEHLRKAEVRPRDVPKYLRKYGAAALASAFEEYERQNRKNGNSGHTE